MIQSVIQYGDLVSVLTTDRPYSPDVADDLAATNRRQLMAAYAQLPEATEPEPTA